MDRRFMLLLFLAACGKTSEQSPDASADGSVAAEDGGDARLADSGDFGPPDGRLWNIVDGGGGPECESPRPDAVHACCNGAACSGFCLGLSDAAVECSCFGIPNGCPSGYICCYPTQGCTGPLGCAGH